MKHALLLCLSLLPPAVPACAQTVIDGSDKAASPFVKNTLKSVATQFPDAHPHFRNLATHKTGEKQIVCGEVSLQDTKTPAAESFMPFGATEGEDRAVVFEPHAIPAALDFREVNSWINHGADLEDLEEMGCVPEGSYRKYSDRLNAVLQNRKTSS